MTENRAENKPKAEPKEIKTVTQRRNKEWDQSAKRNKRSVYIYEFSAHIGRLFASESDDFSNRKRGLRGVVLSNFNKLPKLLQNLWSTWSFAAVRETLPKRPTTGSFYSLRPLVLAQSCLQSLTFDRCLSKRTNCFLVLQFLFLRSTQLWEEALFEKRLVPNQRRTSADQPAPARNRQRLLFQAPRFKFLEYFLQYSA